MSYNQKNRFYLEALPKNGQLVVIKIEELTDIGVRVNLLEYGNIEGLIMLNELTRKRFRSINQLVNIGNIEVAEVIGIDTTKGHIDLSKKNVENQTTELDLIMNKYQQASRVHSIVTEVSNKSLNKLSEEKEDDKYLVENIYKNFIWTIDNPYQYFQKYADLLHNGLAHTISPPFPSDYILFTNIIPLRIKPRNHRLKAEFTLNCNTRLGIDSIVSALKEGIDKHSLENSDINTGLKIIYIKSPIYELSTETTFPQQSIVNMSDCLTTIINKIKELGGSGSVTIPPYSLDEDDKKIISNNQSEEEIE